jgi:hypothetical protein
MIDLDAHYTVRGSSGVAWYLLGYAKERTEERCVLDCDDSHDHDELCYYPQESEEVDDTSRVRAIMVGDDRIEIIDVDDLVLIEEDEFCRDCGQTGCTSNTYE